MQEIKTFIRQHRNAEVLQALRQSGLCELAPPRRQLPQHHGIPGATAAGEHGPDAAALPMDLAEAVVTEYRLELACVDDVDDVADAPVDAIAKAAHTGQTEASWISVSDIQRAVEVRGGGQ